MEDIIYERLLEQYENLFVEKNADVIEKLRLGLFEEDCSIPVISIIINCIENIELFNNAQLDNINHLINKLAHV
jgi:hypothetical protein